MLTQTPLCSPRIDAGRLKPTCTSDLKNPFITFNCGCLERSIITLLLPLNYSHSMTTFPLYCIIIAALGMCAEWEHAGLKYKFTLKTQGCVHQNMLTVHMGWLSIHIYRNMKQCWHACTSLNSQGRINTTWALKLRTQKMKRSDWQVYCSAEQWGWWWLLVHCFL